ncbi:MAG: hypothetical protein ACRD3R_09060, partial [Terriglobales bacterium]
MLFHTYPGSIGAAMPLTLSPDRTSIAEELPAVEAQLSYLAPGGGPVQVRVHPPASGRATV